MLTIFKKKEEDSNLEQIPAHIGIIMDGNGRWAKKRFQPRVMGHKAGMDALQNVTIEASQLGVKVLTVYAFSTENWSRPVDEVSFIMDLPVEFFDKYVPELHRNNVKIQVIGDSSKLPHKTLEALERACYLTQNNSGLILNFALNYGGRTEIIVAAQKLSEAVQSGVILSEEISEEIFSDYLMTANLPKKYRDPELIIRTSGELRLSNFLPWQSAYSEFYFTDVLWPDFDGKCLVKAIEEFNQRHRRFGGI